MEITFDLATLETPALLFIVQALEPIEGDSALIALVDAVAQPLYEELQRRHGARKDASPVAIEVPMEAATADDISRLGTPLLSVPSKLGDEYWHFGSSFCLLLVAHLNVQLSQAEAFANVADVVH